MNPTPEDHLEGPTHMFYRKSAHQTDAIMGGQFFEFWDLRGMWDGDRMNENVKWVDLK